MHCWSIEGCKVIDSAGMSYNECYSLYDIGPRQDGNRSNGKETPWARPLLDRAATFAHRVLVLTRNSRQSSIRPTASRASRYQETSFPAADDPRAVRKKRLSAVILF